MKTKKVILFCFLFAVEEFGVFLLYNLAVYKNNLFKTSFNSGK